MLVALLSLALAPAVATSPASRQKSIVVIGRAIQDRRAALTACIERQCPANEEIDASLALAESQLLAGDYHNARRTLLKALSRNRDEAGAYPIPVSDLYRANGRVAAHLGMDEDYYRSTWGIYNTLKKGLPSEKDRQYSAMMEVAEMMGATRGHDRAREYYRSISYHAKRDGRPDIAALAELRMILRHFPAWARPDAIRKIAESNDPATRASQLEGRLALARIAYERNRPAEADAQIAKIAALKIKHPILIYAPPYQLPASQNSPGEIGSMQKFDTALTVPDGERSVRRATSVELRGPKTFATSRVAPNVEDMWLDVRFRIANDGTVTDLETLNSRGDLGWTKSLLGSIAGRRYTPLAAGTAPYYKTERYTFTSALEPGAATHAELHSPVTRVEYMDLSDISAPN